MAPSLSSVHQTLFSIDYRYLKGHCPELRERLLRVTAGVGARDKGRPWGGERAGRPVRRGNLIRRCMGLVKEFREGGASFFLRDGESGRAPTMDAAKAKFLANWHRTGLNGSGSSPGWRVCTCGRKPRDATTTK